MSQEKKLIERTSKLVDQYNKVKDLRWELHQNSSQLVEANFKHEQSEKKFDQAIEKFMLVHLEDYTNDQVIKKVIRYLGAEHEKQAKKILSKFKKQMEL
jgi:hypothetical protein